MKKLITIPAAVLILMFQTVNGQTANAGDNPKNVSTTIRDNQDTMNKVLDDLQNDDDNSSIVIAPLAKLSDLVKKVVDLRSQMQSNNNTPADSTDSKGAR